MQIKCGNFRYAGENPHLNSRFHVILMHVVIELLHRHYDFNLKAHRPYHSPKKQLTSIFVLQMAIWGTNMFLFAYNYILACPYLSKSSQWVLFNGNEKRTRTKCLPSKSKPFCAYRTIYFSILQNLLLGILMLILNRKERRASLY